MKLRAYFWKDDVDADYGIAIVAKNAKRAKELGYAYWASDVGVEQETWINQRVSWQRDANINGIKEESIISSIEGIRRNICGWIEEEPCDRCGHQDTLYHHEGKAMCNNCIDEVKE